MESLTLLKSTVSFLNFSHILVVHTAANGAAVIGAFVNFANSTSPFVKQLVVSYST